ncbi:hypothetical protein OLX02_15615 [Novosphingobium sp. KCTC 2891]|uniref:hypothetical protein n=1 Tax=Novosphingobium sp. KCTC 2891 TaxID=2989730 RepID=UPI00222199E2|nr:hypothetical protein [Novosphingobium sp. KCTC 2891]MCW1384252.1 hypothetical protein [Novosphingobium sp. KCTC 2891]
MSIGWIIEPECRERLLELFPPRYPRTVAHHVSRRPGNGEDGVPPPPISHARIVGHVDDGKGVEALVVALEGSTSRPDGGTWHVTWSLGEDRAARESNEVLAKTGWEPCDGGSIRLTPAVW